MATVTNLVLMLLTGDDFASLESVALYCFGTMLLATTTQLRIVNTVLEATGIALINIVPMLIIVRVCLGHHTQDATEIAASLAANATHQAMILSARPSIQQSSNLPIQFTLLVLERLRTFYTVPRYSTKTVSPGIKSSADREASWA
ncbi:hypothetical protein B0H19DRAFT_1225924 [Mycena capillaripes]|nr:hypothetical protein B0H19DRAFT_1225924 [Mycena capillaripes]